MKRRTFVTSLAIFTIAAVVLSLTALSLFFKQNIVLAAIVAAVFVVVFLIIYYSMDVMRAEANKDIENRLDLAYKEVLEHCDIGILAYNDNYEIVFLSDFFLKRNMDHLNEKLLNWLPELQEMLKNEANTQTVIINDEKYSVYKIDKESILIFKNITVEYDLNKKLGDSSCVLGLISYDNYDESMMSEDDLSYVNSYIKVPVIDYFKNYQVVYKTLKNNRMLLIMNEQIFRSIMNDRFSILNKVRKVSKDAGLDVTLSMAFSRGSENYEELDESVRSLLTLAQTRGGDQVVVRKIGEDAMFFGGNSEARENQNKTKVRVASNSIRDLIEKSRNVIIVGHKEMDADCVGSAIAMSVISLSLDKPTYIVSRSGGMEPMIYDVMKKYAGVLEKKHTFVTETEAMEQLDDETLVIMVDHHSMLQSNGSDLLAKARKIIIIDHHRRRADLDVIPMMAYVEAAASSTCEIAIEFFPYFGRKVEVSPEEANIMYLGILIDTDRFRVRTGSRTFDVAKQLRRYGADPMLCDELSQEPYENVMQRSKIINAGKLYRNEIMIASLNEGIFSRSLASQACDMMVKVKEIEAAFVICYTGKEEAMISARSKGKINVQVIMEKMQGGGHMTAAGMQASNTAVSKLEADLLRILDDYLKGESDESNTVN